MLRVLTVPIFLAILVGCASQPDAPAADAAPERRLERPAGQPAPTRAIPPGLDAGEAALAESEALEPNGAGPNADIIIPGQRERPVDPIPGEDPRSDQQRAEHIRAWDRCVTAGQRRQEDMLGGAGSASPVASTPEEYCSSRLGMSGRNSIPESWSRRR